MGFCAYWVSAGSYCFDSFCCGFVEGGWPGLAPAGEVLFFASPKKSTQKKGDPAVCDPFAVRRGNLRRGACGVRRGTHCAATQLRSDNHGESEYEACALRRACPPRKRPAAGAARRGWKEHGPSLRSAPRSRRAAPAPCRPSAAMARVVFWPGFPSVRAEKRRAGGGACAEGHTHFVN